MTDPLFHSVRRIRDLLLRRTLSARDLVRLSLERENQVSSLNAFLHVNTSGARYRAAVCDERLAQGTAGLLEGIPIAIKDNICVDGQPMTCGSRLLEGFFPSYDATAVVRLRQAGAVLVGKTNLDEFAMGSSNEYSAFGPCRNPWSVDCSPGGSSGGSAVAVATGVAPLALGSDTGGSVRLPAALTGVVGLRPTYGSVSRFGLTAHASSMDQIGPMGRHVRDVALLYHIIAGPDPRDATSDRDPTPPVLKGIEDGVQGLRIGVPLSAVQRADAEVAQAVDDMGATLERLGATLVPVAWPDLDACLAAYYVIADAEASSNLARFDGVRYGNTHAPVRGRDPRPYEPFRTAGFGREVKRRILLGTHVLSAGYRAGVYGAAATLRDRVRADLTEVFDRSDLVLTPVSPVSRVKLGERKDPLAMYALDTFTVPASLAGLPALSVPAAVGPSGLPISIQLMGPRRSEPLLFRAARALERERPWGERRPDISRIKRELAPGEGQGS